MPNQYSVGAICKYAFLMGGMLAFGTLTHGWGMILVGLLAFGAICRDRSVELVFWSLFMLFMSSANRTLFANNGIAILITRAALILMTMALAGKLLTRGGAEARMVTPFWGILFYIFWECLVSAQGWDPIVSYLKLALFFVIYLGMIGATNQVNRSTRTNAKILRSAILAAFVLIVLGSVALIPFGVGQMGGEDAIEAIKQGYTSLFMGMCCHSQALGVIIAMIGVFLYADLAFSIQKTDRLYLLLIVCCPVLIYKTACRTAMGAFIAGVGLVTFLVVRSKGLSAAWRSQLQLILVTLAMVGGMGVASLPEAREKITQYVLKYGGDVKRISAVDVLSSRQYLIDKMVANIRKNPYCGNGFQVSEEMKHQLRSGWTSYLSAPIEKSTWLFAIPEEGGYIGMALFCGWLLYLFPTLIRRHAYIGASLFFTMLVCNLGEFGIFAMSYTGGFFWTLVFAGICLDVQRMKGTQMQVFAVPIEEIMKDIGVQEWLRPQG